MSELDLETAVLARDASASLAFLKCAGVETGNDRNLARSHAHRAVESGEKPAMGGCMSALWNGQTELAWRRADRQNRRIMLAAGVAPTDKEVSDL